MNVDFLNIYTLDWGFPYLDYYNVKNRNATIILNFSFFKDDVEDIFRYTLSHVLWAFQNVPKGTLVTVLFDIRGQKESGVDFKNFEKRLQASLNMLIGKARLFIVFKS